MFKATGALMKPLVFCLNLFIFCYFLSLAFNTPSIAQQDNSLSSSCPNFIDCIFMRDPIRVQQFIDEGADINMQNPYGNTVLMFAADAGDIDTLVFLLDLDANPDIININSYTPLIAASKNEHLDIVALLIEAGADVTIKNFENRTAFYYIMQAIRNMGIYEDPDRLDKLLEIAVALREKERENQNEKNN